MSMASSTTGTTGLPLGKGSQSVLVVEDDPGLATQLVRGLTRGGLKTEQQFRARNHWDLQK